MLDRKPNRLSVGTIASPVVAALPLAAAATLILVRALPIHFEFEPNDLGIVSATTKARYPKQQETFWYLFSCASAALLTTGFALFFRRRRWSGLSGPLLEVIGTAALVAVLALPQGAAEAAFLGCLVLMVGMSLGARADVSHSSAQFPPAPPLGPRRIWLWLPLFVLLGFLLTPSVLPIRQFVAGVPDTQFINKGFDFLAEMGQHLAWTDRLMAGQVQGRDYFCLYGPFFDLSLAAVWEMFGRSVGSYPFYLAVTKALGCAAVLWLGAMLVYRPILVLFFLPFALALPTFRIGLGLFGLACMAGWLRSGGRGWCVTLGFINGTALLYSEEFGLALLILSALALAIRWNRRETKWFIWGFAIPVVPTLGYYAIEGALAPLLRDMASYPYYVMNGFGARPFPFLIPHLPIKESFFAAVSVVDSNIPLRLRTGYLPPAIFLGAAMLSLPFGEFDPSRPVASLRAVRERLARDQAGLALLVTALFGLLIFKTALGRSHLVKNVAVMPVAAILLTVAMDRTVPLWRSGLRLLPLAAWRTTAILLLVWLGAFSTVTSPVATARKNISILTEPLHPFRQRAPKGIEDMVRWIRDNSEPSDPVLFIPNDAAYYYLTERKNPTRFDLTHQIVTNDHRAEFLSDLQRNPPRWIVEQTLGIRVDGISSEEVFGRKTLTWIAANYQIVKRIDTFVIAGPRGGGGAESEAGR